MHTPGNLRMIGIHRHMHEYKETEGEKLRRKSQLGFIGIDSEYSYIFFVLFILEMGFMCILGPCVCKVQRDHDTTYWT